MRVKRLSILVPCYNEISTIQTLFERLKSVFLGCEKEIIFVDDGSTDGTKEYLETLERQKIQNIKVLSHGKNLGKGTAIQTGLKHATGDYAIFQDADLEYNPQDISALLGCIEKTGSLVVYGSRNREIKNRHIYRLFYFGSKVLTGIINIFFRQNITDPETCYKCVHLGLLRFIRLTEKRFGMEIEITAKIAKLGIPIHEVPISYQPRSFSEGKKIRSRDGVRALYLVFRYFCTDLHFGPVDQCIRFFRVRQAEKYRENFRGKSILDLGCGRQGFLGWRWREIAKEYVGLDSEIVPAKISHLTFIQDDISQIKKHFSGEYFDVVCGLAIIEHVDDPKKMARDSFTVLRAGGIILLTTPSRFSEPILKILSYCKLINKGEIDAHKRYFTLSDAKALLQSAGFAPVAEKKFLFGFNSLVVAQKPK